MIFGGGWPFQDVDDASSLTIVIVQAKLFVVHVIQHTLTLFILPASATPMTQLPTIASLAIAAGEMADFCQQH